MRKLLSATLVLMLSASSQALAHPPVTLYDVNGKPILDANGTVQSHLPVSYEKSCSGCHNLNFINMGWHMQQGRLSTLSPDIYSQVYSKWGSTNGLPQNQSGLYMKWFGTKNIYGPGGMYNRVSVPHMLKLAPYSTKDRLNVAFTTADWVSGDCAICHPGGGYALVDQKGNKLSKASQIMGKVQSDLNNGIYDSDYLKQNEENGTLEVYSYQATVDNQTIPNVRDNDCLMCHAENGYDLGTARIAIMKGEPVLANTFAAGLENPLTPQAFMAIPTQGIDYNATKVENFQENPPIASTTDETCARCHAGVYDEGNFTPNSPAAFYAGMAGTTDGKITPWDNIDVFPTVFAMMPQGNMTQIETKMMYIHQALAFFSSPGAFKRGMVIGNTIENGHKVYDPNVNVTYYNPIAKSWEPVPYVGVHMQDKDMKCSSCHQQVTSNTLQYAQPSWMPSHDFGKGTDGFNVRSDLDGTTTCIMCHGDYEDIHKGTFAGYEDVHMKYIHCTTCHIPQKFKGIAHTIIEDKVGSNPVTWTMQPANVVLVNATTNGVPAAVVPFKPDYVWFPHIKSKGATPQLMVKPANAIAVLTWRLSDGRPVPSRFLHMVFGNGMSNKMVDPVTGDNMTLTRDTQFEKYSPMAATPLVTSAKEISFAAHAIEHAIKKVTGQDVKVQYIYHLGILDGAYIMSHNIAPVSSDPMQSGGDAAYANDPTHVLQCQDCHNAKGKFNRAVQKYPHIDTVPGVTVFEVPKAAINGYNGKFTEADLRRLTFAYYSPTDVQVFPPEDGNAIITKVWTPKGGDVEPTTGVDSIDTSFVPSGYTVEQAMTFDIDNGNSTTFEILPLQGNATDYKVFSNPSSAVSYSVEPNGRIKVALTATRGSDVTVAVAKTSTTTPPSGNGTSGGNATTSGGGGGGGCSLTPSAGFGGILSMIAGLLPFGILRRKKEEE